MLCNAPVRRAVLREPPMSAPLVRLSADGSWSGLSLANQLLADRQLEELARAGITEVEVLHRGSESRSRYFAELGARWGVALSARPLQGGAPPADGAPTLHLRMDCWPGADGLQALLFGSCMPERRLAGAAGPLPCHVSAGHRDPAGSLVYCRDALLIATLEDYWKASLELLARLALTNHLERALGGERYVGAGARVHGLARIEGPCLIGSGAYVAKRCIVGPRSIIGDGAYLDVGVQVTDSVLLGDCHIDRGTELNGVIVAGEEVYCWRTGQPLAFDRTVVLANRWVRPREEARFPESVLP